MFSFASSSAPHSSGLPFDGFSSHQSPPSNSSKPASNPSNEHTGTQPTCTNQFFLSPDGRSHHSYHDGNIISCFAPFNDDSVKIITALPNAIVKVVNLDSILGFLCVGEANKEKDVYVLPWMCLYTSSSAFLFSIGYTKDSDKGTILKLLEPFERPLLSPLAPQIIRVRSPPEICRAGAMACMLKENDGYSIVLYHGVEDNKESISTPLRFSTADLLRGWSGVTAENFAYDSSEVHIVDFCFSSSASVLVLSSDGGVYGASPLLFDGMCIPRLAVLDMVSRLDNEIDEASKSRMGVDQEARLRQCKAARRYWIDAFGLNSIDDGYYVNASVIPGRQTASQAICWQPRIQGPLAILPSEEEKENGTSYQCIESFGERNIVDGFVVARYDLASSNLEVAFGVVPGHGAVLLPRFEFESSDDGHVIDDIVRETGFIVERALVHNRDEEDEDTCDNENRILVPSLPRLRSINLVTDPLDDRMVHVITNSRVVTVSTTALAATSEYFQVRLDGQSSVREANEKIASIKTKVWASLDSMNETLLGAGVSTDVHLGHILVANMSDGSTEVVNITTAQCIYEASLQMEAKMKQFPAIQDDTTPDILKKIKPLNELLQPLTDEVCDGLSKMGKIVGGNTMPKDVGPENLAVFIETQRSCEQNIVLPMDKMSRIIRGRKDLLNEMLENQSAELKQLIELLEKVKIKYELNQKKATELETASASLASRSSAVLTATQALYPQITDAEAQYFKDLERYEMSCNKWEEQTKQISNDADTICKAMSAGAIESGEIRCLADLPPDKLDVCHKMLRGEKELLVKAEYKINESTTVLSQVSPTVTTHQMS